MRVSIALTALALLGGCTNTQAAGQPDAEASGPVEIGRTSRDRIVPLVDAHQHLMSPAMVALIAPRGALPSVVVPAPLSDLLRAREAVMKSGPLSSVFTHDAVLFAEGEGRWWSGEAQIVKALGEFPAARKFVPVSYGAEGATGYISGDLQTPSGENTHNFVLGLKKGPEGRWRIASEMKQRIMPPTYAPAITAERVIDVLDDAGIARSVVLSLGYIYGQPGRVLPGDQYTLVQAENDWTVAQAGKHPDRLTPFCGINPFADYTVAEMERCARMPSVRGVKTHLNNAAADLSQPEQLEKLKLFFRTANRLGLAIVIHVRGSAKPLIDQVLPEAPDVPIQIAHMGSGWSNAVLFADAIQAGKPSTKNLYFDWTQALPIEGLWGYGPSETISGSVSTETKAKVAETMRRIGLDRILYGTDMALRWNPTPRDWWRKTILTLPLTDEEISDIADNVPSYLQR
jgi:predicted TIM-barrel fold metal-dependent hydrolase